MSSTRDPEFESLKLPPHSLEAEQSVLGGLLIDNGAWDKIIDIVKESDIYREDHRLIFRHIGQMIAASKPADVITVFEALKSVNKTDDIGGLEYLNALAQNVPSAANIRRYAELVRDRGILRKLIGVSEEISSAAFNTQAGATATDEQH